MGPLTEDDDTMTASDVVVIVPDRYGRLTVCTAADLLARLVDGESLDDAILNSGIDDCDGTPEALQKVYQLNASGNAANYWEMT